MERLEEQVIYSWTNDGDQTSAVSLLDGQLFIGMCLDPSDDTWEHDKLSKEETRLVYDLLKAHFDPFAE